MAAPVQIVEVGPRDGLQNEKRILTPQQRAAFVRGLVAAGATRLEVASFVDPRRVPQMGGAEEILDILGEHPGVSFIGLVLNQKGADRAIATGMIDELNVVVPVTDTFGKANQGMPTEGALDVASRVREISDNTGLRWSVTLAVAFGCPYEGTVSLSRLETVAGRIAALAPDELALADTIGCAVPDDITTAVSIVRKLTTIPLRAHFHDTRHTGLANVHAAVASGVHVIDASAAGLGGCPFAPGAAGNVPTEDVVWMLERGEHHTGIDASALARTGIEICSQLGVTTRSGIASAGLFPAPEPAAM